MSKTRRPRRFRAALVVGVVGLALTGCGGLRPGVAVQVGDETISTSEVDDISTDFCEAITPQLDQEASTYNNVYLRGGIVGTLAMRTIAEQVAAEHGVDPTQNREYKQRILDVRRQAASLPEDVRDSVIEVQSAPPYVETVQTMVGRQLLDGDGDREAFRSRGQQEFDRWVAENGVEFDPAFNVVIRDGTIAQEDQSVSHAVSDEARQGEKPSWDEPVARELPRSHRCGR